MEDAISVIGERAPRQAQLALATLKLALRNARERGQTVRPRTALDRPARQRRARTGVLDVARGLELVSWMLEQILRIGTVAALTGAREGELFALREDDVDFDDETLLVVTTGSNRRANEDPWLEKDDRSSAACHPASARAAVGPLAHPPPSRLPSSRGRRLWNKDNFTARVIRPAVRRAAEKHRREHGVVDEDSTPFDGLTLHDLRHTCASLMIAAANRAGAGQAVTMKAIAEQLGHTDGGVLVLRRYGHLFKGTRRQVALALDIPRQYRDADAAPRAGSRRNPPEREVRSEETRRATVSPPQSGDHPDNAVRGVVRV